VEQVLPTLVPLTKILLEGTDPDLLERVAQGILPGRPQAARGILASLLAVSGHRPEAKPLVSMIEEGSPGLAALAAGARAFARDSSEAGLQEYWRGYFVWVTGKGYLTTTYREKLGVFKDVPSDRWRPETQTYLDAYWKRAGTVVDAEVTAALAREIRMTKDAAFARDLLSRHLDHKSQTVLDACLDRIPSEEDRHLRLLALRVVGEHAQKKELFDRLLSWYHTEPPEGAKAYMAQLLLKRMPAEQAVDFAAKEYQRDAARTMHRVFIDELWQSDLPEAKDALHRIVIGETNPESSQYALKRFVESNRFREQEKVVSLLKRLEDQRPSVRLFCLNALVDLQGSEAIPKIRRLAEEDPDPSVRKIAQQHLKKLEGKRGTEDP
jgi:hypothetical protein